MATMHAHVRDDTRECSRPYAHVLATKKFEI
jgi:hypothetical protein